METKLTYKNIWNISAPIMLALIAQNVINVTDTAFLGRVGEVELGASAIAGIFYVSLYMIGFGFGSGLQILIARRNGEKNYAEIGSTFDNGFYFLLFLAAALILISNIFAPYFFKVVIHSKEIYTASVGFLSYRIWGLLFSFIGTLFRSFYIGITNTKYLSISAAIMAIVNVFLDYALIFGHWGMPAMGLKGAAIANVISEAIATIFFFYITFTNKELKEYNLFKFRKPEFALIKKTLNISVFIMFQYFISLSGWFAFFLIIEKCGERPLAISNIIRSIYMVLMIPVWGYCSTTSSLVSNAIGSDETRTVISIIKKITLMSLLTAIILVLIIVIFPSQVLGLYTNDLMFIKDSIPTLNVIAGATLVFSIMMIPFSGVSGTANTNIALFIETFTIFLYLIAALLLANFFSHSIEVIWCAEYIYYIFIGIFSVLYLRFGKWRGKVI